MTQLPCEMDPDRWFADCGTQEGERRVLSAIAGCKACPALEACMKLASTVKPKWGVWAGQFYTDPRRGHRSRQENAKRMGIKHG